MVRFTWSRDSGTASRTSGWSRRGVFGDDGRRAVAHSPSAGCSLVGWITGMVEAGGGEEGAQRQEEARP